MTGLVRRIRTGRGAQAGVTLVELLVYSVLLTIILLIVGSVLVRGLLTQRDVRAVSEATTTAQNVAQSVERGVRNAAAVGYSTSATGELLTVRTRVADTSTSAWYCQAWFVDTANGGTVYMLRRPASGAGPVLVEPSTPAALGEWTRLADEVSPFGSSTVFQLAGQTVSFDFRVAAGAQKPVGMSSHVTARTQGETGSTPCF